MKDLEFTMENGKLFLLQTRNGKRTAQAAINVVVDFVNEGLLTKEEAILKVNPESLNQLLHPTFDDKELKSKTPIAKGLSASPGAASGKIYFHSKDVAEKAKANEKLILVRHETSPEDIEGMISAEGILTARGGMTSHAAVVARGMGKCCVAGASDIKVDEDSNTMKIGDKIYHEGDVISINGNTGLVYEGVIKKVNPSLSGNFATFMTWVDEVRELKVRTNADTPRDAKQALEFGAEGIGLCRTEHMFFDEKRIPSVRKMILSKTIEKRNEALEEIRPMQEKDFYDIYAVMEEKPVTIRLLDPPLHEFLPNKEEDIKNLSLSLNLSYEELKDRIAELHEVNPMLGHRGCRLSITFPEIYKMQVNAIINAAIKHKKEGLNIVPEIMIPLVGEINELAYVKKEIIEEIEKVFNETNQKIEYKIGTMIEIPRAALLADEIAKEAEFFSFGTNDLTQMTFGFSRDDSGKFLSEYIEKGIFKESPFTAIDRKGVGKLMKMACELGRNTNKELHLGICGEHGGNAESVEFCNEIGLDYVSCSPFRVPIAKLAAAQSVIKNKK